MDDGLYYWEDQNHAGKAWVTEEMVKKYGMKEEETLLEYYCDDGELLEEIWEDVTSNYTHAIHIDHCSGVSKTQGDYKELTQETPHGEC